MKDTIVITDSCANLPEEYIEKYNIPVIPIYYRFDQNIYGDENLLTSNEFYNRIRQGKMPYTMCSELGRVKEIFESALQKYNNIIYICFSSVLSSTYSNTMIIKEQLKETYNDKNVYVLDSLTGTLGQGFMVKEAVKMIENNNTYEQIINILEQNKRLYKTEFILEDLKHLKRGGRLSSTTAFVGGVLNIKPLVHLDEQGKTSMISKCRGQKVALQTITNRVIESADFNKPIGIIHADNIVKANELKESIENLKELKDFIITDLNPAIGAHMGADCVGVAYVKKQK